MISNARAVQSPKRTLVERLPRPSKSQHDSSKRLFDCVFSMAVIVLLSPLYLIIAIIIRLSSPGKIIYTQTRLGRGGKVFRCYKFRTMYSDADKRLIKILANDPKKRIEWELSQKLRDDPRIFPFGRYLRKLSLDELPQFWNVLKGDLSVVGPRPYMISQRRKIGSYVNKILGVRPGITGLWQTSGRSNTSFSRRIILDNEYVNRRCFWLDCYLILKTIPQIFFAKDAF